MILEQLMHEKSSSNSLRILHVRNRPNPTTDYPAALSYKRTTDENAKHFALIFFQAGFSYESAESGEEALESIALEAPDAVIVDTDLIDMSGFEFVRRMKNEKHHLKIPLVQITSDSSSGLFSMEPNSISLSKVADTYLVSPVPASLALFAIQTLLRIREIDFQAEQTLKIRDEFLASLSHDLKNPLSAIKVTAQILQRDADAAGPHGELPAPAIAGHVARLLRTTERMEGLIKKLTDYANLSNGNLRLQKEACNLRTLIGSAVDQCNQLAVKKGIELSFDDRLGDGQFTAELDPERIGQLLSKLIGNAIHFTPSGGSIRVSAEAVAGDILFSVKDSGTGIEPDKMAHLFEMNPKSNGSPHGFGLGLTIAKKIVNGHGGIIRAESELGRGSAFYVSLPQH